MTLLIASDEDVRGMSAATAVQTMREVLATAAEGGLLAPPRVHAELGHSDFVFTVGQLADGTSGFRAYRAGQPAADQLTAVWSPSGELRGIVAGDELGARRTGALGGVAIDQLARANAASVGIVGTGRQAWPQLWALLAVRAIDEVRVYARTAERREAFAERARRELSVDARAVQSASEAVRGAAIVVLATTSRTPVIDPQDIAAGTHVTTVGPKGIYGHEAPVELVTRAAVVACDSPAQALAYPEPFFTGDTELVALADLVAGQAPGRQAQDEVTLYCSIGLAGTEVALATRLLDELPPTE